MKCPNGKRRIDTSKMIFRGMLMKAIPEHKYFWRKA
jgi:hypothetical protein